MAARYTAQFGSNTRAPRVLVWAARGPHASRWLARLAFPAHAAATPVRARDAPRRTSAPRARRASGAVRGLEGSIADAAPPSTLPAAHGGEAALLAGGAALLVAAASFGVATHGVDETLALAASKLEDFTALVQSLGPAGWLLYMGTYAAMEVLLLPATPLALTAGALFGTAPGTMLSAVGGLAGATTAFLLGRYALRERVLAAAQDAPQFAALDRAIGRDGFKVTLLVNLSPASSLQNLLNYCVRARLLLAACCLLHLRVRRLC